MDEMSCLYRFFDASLPQLGPGNDESTGRALGIVMAHRAEHDKAVASGPLRVLDIGCGNGVQTLALARRVDGEIVAVDNHRPYLDELQRRAESAGVGDRVRVCEMDMQALDPADGRYELVWSEASLYSMGFEAGLAVCRSLLTEGGMAAVSEMVWLREEVPAECRAFFAEEYPPMMDVAGNVSAIERAGFELIDHFTLPESAWQGYYGPLAERLALCRRQYADDPTWQTMLDMIEREITIRQQYRDCYGYEFFIVR